MKKETVFTKDGVELEKQSNKYKGRTFYDENGGAYKCKGYSKRLGDCIYTDMQKNIDVVGCVSGFYYKNPIKKMKTKKLAKGGPINDVKEEWDHATVNQRVGIIGTGVATKNKEYGVFFTHLYFS